ncbi:hypothetical protein BLNAU_4830 [Blattamonas nauphoetae]|uniref:Uncharacterized protein n=1 Tax=Blattamonas nauphoetae TaxID=2049346 RepID=A0ABQ9Y970_9EUKA|nr:hypothetical protein BLNAU_4830 [Blattamonas nauphoetae]
MGAVYSRMISSTVYSCPDCSAFLKWRESKSESESEKAVVFRSLVATVKLQPALDASLEAKAVRFLKSVGSHTRTSADAFLSNFASFAGGSLTDFTQSLVALISSPNPVIIAAVIKMLGTLISWCSTQDRLALVKADMIPQLINTLHPQSLSFVEAEDIHAFLLNFMTNSLWYSTPDGLESLENEDQYDQHNVYRTVFQHLLVPSESYILHLCQNRYSIVDGRLSSDFIFLLTRLLFISPFYQQIMDFVLHMPVVLAIPSCLAHLENDATISFFLIYTIDTHDDGNIIADELSRSRMTPLRSLMMEGFADVMEQKLQHIIFDSYEDEIVDYSISLNTFQGMNFLNR